MKVWQETEELADGKYLVVRRDGTIPAWAAFIMGEHDPASAAGVRGYADKAKELGYEAEYVASLYDLADKYERAAKKWATEGKKVDPEAPPHRVDSPVVIAMMRGRYDVATMIRVAANYGAHFVGPDGKEAIPRLPG